MIVHRNKIWNQRFVTKLWKIPISQNCKIQGCRYCTSIVIKQFWLRNLFFLEFWVNISQFEILTFLQFRIVIKKVELWETFFSFFFFIPCKKYTAITNIQPSIQIILYCYYILYKFVAATIHYTVLNLIVIWTLDFLFIFFVLFFVVVGYWPSFDWSLAYLYHTDLAMPSGNTPQNLTIVLANY